MAWLLNPEQIAGLRALQRERDLALLGRVKEAPVLCARLLSLRNDLGLFSEEYDQEHQRLIGNFPQAFSHIGLVNAAWAIQLAEERRDAGRSGGSPAQSVPDSR